MLTLYLKKFFYQLFIILVALICGLWIAIAILIILFKYLKIPDLYAVSLTAIILTFVAAYLASKDITSEYQKKNKEEIKLKEQAQKEEERWKQSLKEKSAGFPTLLKAIEEYEKIKDERVEQYLRYKKHPSLKGAEVVREEAQRRRQAEFENKNTRAIIEYYESIAPFLVDLKNDIVVAEDEDKYRGYNEEESLDPTTHYLTKEEYRKLPSVEKNQLALDRFWTRPKSNWLLGRIYERYVGYLYELNGYDVEYVGIFKGYEDLGRDLICRHGNDIIVIQCKNWSQFKTIYEKHIFQFFGTVFQFRDANPGRQVRAIFYTTTQLSDLARRFARELGIGLQENFKFDRAYPSIKCNISRIDGTKIYHLPFDQQYDKVKVEKVRGEFYCAKVKEAEERSFRRAFRYRGGDKK